MEGTPPNCGAGAPRHDGPMTETRITFDTPEGAIDAYLHTPPGGGPFPGVVVVHDALGLSQDIRDHAARIAERGYVVLTPDLYSRGGKARCVTGVMRDLVLRKGRAVGDILAAREELLRREDCTGAVGVLGFCMGGGFALVTAPKGFDVSAPFYGVVPVGLAKALEGACPVVASLGSRDPLLIAGERRLRKALDKNGVEHDVKTYKGVGHSFANKIDWGVATPLLRVTGFHYGEEATRDAFDRVFAFFGEHLRV